MLATLMAAGSTSCSSWAARATEIALPESHQAPISKFNTNTTANMPRYSSRREFITFSLSQSRSTDSPGATEPTVLQRLPSSDALLLTIHLLDFIGEFKYNQAAPHPSEAFLRAACRVVKARPAGMETGGEAVPSGATPC